MPHPHQGQLQPEHLQLQPPQNHSGTIDEQLPPGTEGIHEQQPITDLITDRRQHTHIAADIEEPQHIDPHTVLLMLSEFTKQPRKLSI